MFSASTVPDEAATPTSVTEHLCPDDMGTNRVRSEVQIFPHFCAILISGLHGFDRMSLTPTAQFNTASRNLRSYSTARSFTG